MNMLPVETTAAGGRLRRRPVPRLRRVEVHHRARDRPGRGRHGDVIDGPAGGHSRLSAVPKLQLLPAVDVADGQAVRLVQGEAGSETSYGDPLDAALAWQRDGAEWVHLVDLDAAFGRGSNRELLARVVGELDVDVELSGGIRDDASLAAALATGCRRVNLGTAALEYPEWCARAIAEHGDRIAVGLDVRGTRLAARGWTQRGRRAVRDAGPPRRRGLRPLRGHRHHQGRHAARAQPRPAARGLRRDPDAGDRLRRGQLARRPPRAGRADRRSASRARSWARRSTRAPSRCPRRSPSPGRTTS